MSAMDKRITSHEDLIDALGGTNAVAAWAEIMPSAVSYWRAAGIPNGWHLRLALEARKRGLAVDYIRVFGVPSKLLEGLEPDPLANAAA